MATGTVKDSGIDTSQKVKTKGEGHAAKSCESDKCKVCGIKTYQKDGMCVLCKTGITQLYEMIEPLETAKEQEWE